ncbi:MAG: peptidoglycan DD-metalloendopeptidase family protein [Cytophagales bacterium]|nr:peptidoglycan DD-metalloendopeptidase family protein [Cytophagales bacterium]
MNKKYIIGGILVFAAAASYLLWNSNPEYDNQHIEAAVENSLPDSSGHRAQPTVLFGFEVDSLVVIEDRIKRNQNLSEILVNYNISHRKIHELAINSKPVFDVRKIVSNRKYTMLCYPDSLKTAKAMIYEPSPTEYIVFNLEDSITVEKVAKEIITVERELAGIIERSLAVTIADLGENPQLTNDFVDVLAWQIDFFRLQKGDRFKVIFEEKQVDGEPIGYGKIKGIYLEHFGNPYYAYYFDQGNGIDYFDEEGNSLRKAFLKYPLDFTRISSRYSGNRFHPVQKRWKAHRGTDFAAPKGTPIRSVGDGIVTEARYGVNNGNFVKIKHNATYTTQYLHMSKIASGIRTGVKVTQGQTIGYVGSTGLATGNHLCYRFWKNGVQIDALKVKLPPSEPVHEQNRERFDQVRDALKLQLDGIQFPSPII